MISFTRSVEPREDSGSAGVSSLLQVLVVLAVLGVLVFDTLSCVINRGLADDVAAHAARAAADSFPASALMSNQRAYDVAAAHLARQSPDYLAVPQSVSVDSRGRTVRLKVVKQAPTLLFQRLPHAREWTRAEGEGVARSSTLN